MRISNLFKISISVVLLAFSLGACTKGGESTSVSKKEVVWVYTSLYKDTIADMTPFLEKAYPDIEVKWFQAGSEEISAKVNAEILAANLQADVIIASDRFWYEELANKGLLHPFVAPDADKIPASLKHPQNLYTVASLPVMVIAYNSELVKDPPKSFKDLALPKFKGKVSTGSPLASGTNFTTVAALQSKYGWQYFEELKKNGVLSEGGNSAVIRRLQTGERPVGWVLLENVLRLVKDDKRLKIVYPEDGVVTQLNGLAIMKKPGSRAAAEKVSQWMYGDDGQKAMTRSFMYSPYEKYAAPEGAPELGKLLANAFPWTEDFIKKTTADRETLKEKYTEITF